MSENISPACSENDSRPDFDKLSSRDKTELLQCDVLSYEVTENSFGQASISMNNSNTGEIALCSTEYLSDVILSQPVRGKLFPQNVVVINSFPFEPNPSNIDHMLQECSEVWSKYATMVFNRDRSALELFHQE